MTSKPTSSDDLGGRQRERDRRKTSRRKRGDSRAILAIAGRWCPAEPVNEIIDVFPDACRHCHHTLPFESAGSGGCNTALSSDRTAADRGGHH